TRSRDGALGAPSPRPGNDALRSTIAASVPLEPEVQGPGSASAIVAPPSGETLETAACASERPLHGEQLARELVVGTFGRPLG
ncbi:MAG TPA: hypothetical protein DCQ30_09230, partial [Acidimicrobiaceae bacterium]|nr:hypothetical protein [Acidimicrobiaceae bacterium]